MIEENKSESNPAPRVAINWKEVGALVGEWTIAIGVFAYTVLGAGLAGGIFGHFLDGALTFLHKDWIGYGRMGGWTIGAVITAIGLPLGWGRADDKKWSLPSPRKIRKKVSDRARQPSPEKPDEYRSVGDVLKGSGVLGFFGAILGFFLGGMLLMCWFSLAMSPVAQLGSFESLKFQSAREFHEETTHRYEDRQGTVVTTKNPVAMYLFFSPVLILGILGAATGAVYGTVKYVEYRKNEPPDIRQQLHKP